MQLKEMAERLPTGGFRHGRTGSMSVGRLDTSNGTHSMAAPDMLAPSDGDGVAPLPRKFNENIPVTSVREADGNGITSPHSVSSPLSVRDNHSVGSPRSMSSSGAATESEFGGLQSRVAAAMRVANRATESDSNGFEAAQRNEESGRTMGSSFSSENGREPDTEWVEQDEPGVYITLTALPGGGKDLKRVRFR